ncbi:helix-turn-helix domain-containing protein [Parvibaculum sp.]|jgi:Cu(I)-responsive transcriptional regulator|uniref:MerR family transcriptional regulator n=1 Tax=Parvibaculum sp. TaxID=2024848 RepID=UPI000C5C2C5D|nr:helix-turn-helix domain-containing protein [Parvibaculum sp.]MAM94422.1 MerR family transcriptional regulator [Parvibaculum sp.]|tara:strand:+ start:8371 stop:8817 length:447 start_codon:yes stop_codon:yes gene_type:complete
MSNGTSIGDLAKATGTKVVTIRYYEKIGLLPEPPRTRGNYRIYEALHRERLHFIRRCRDLGFTLEQVRELLDLSKRTDKDCAAVDRLALDHLAEIERKIADLKRLEKELRRLSECCQGGRIGDCRIIETLSHHEYRSLPNARNAMKDG